MNDHVTFMAPRRIKSPTIHRKIPAVSTAVAHPTTAATRSGHCAARNGGSGSGIGIGVGVGIRVVVGIGIRVGVGIVVGVGILVGVVVVVLVAVDVGILIGIDVNVLVLVLVEVLVDVGIEIDIDVVVFEVSHGVTLSCLMKDRRPELLLWGRTGRGRKAGRALPLPSIDESIGVRQA